MSPSLLEVQRSFRDALESGVSPALSSWIVANGIAADARLEIYRNNSRSNLRNALRADYPVIERLTGSAFFLHAADAYLAMTPSTSGDVGEYGQDFPDFLATFTPAASLPYLPDVARLERAWSDALVAAEAVAGDFSAFLLLPPERLGGVRLTLHPALRLVSSIYPVLSIWHANQAAVKGDEVVRLDAGGERVLLRRIGDVVELSRLDPGEYAWLQAFIAGAPLAVAIDAAFEAQHEFDLTASLRRHLVEGSFVSYTEDHSNEK
jgi:hypothetical protein